MKRKNKFLISLATIVIIIIVLSIQSPLHKETIPTRFIAGETMGFDLGPGNLNFGKIVPGYRTTRAITITNTYDHPTTTSITSSGAISPYIIVSENNFNLQPTESKNLTFSCYPEKGIDLIEYPGEITITTHKA